MLNSVVLPAPFGPITPAIEPFGMEIETESTATSPPNRRVTLRVSRIAGTLPGRAAGSACVPASATIVQPSSLSDTSRDIRQLFPFLVYTSDAADDLTRVDLRG